MGQGRMPVRLSGGGLTLTGGGSGNSVTFTIEGPATLGVGNVHSFRIGSPGSPQTQADPRRAGRTKWFDSPKSQNQ